MDVCSSVMSDAPEFRPRNDVPSVLREQLVLRQRILGRSLGRDIQNEALDRHKVAVRGIDAQSWLPDPLRFPLPVCRNSPPQFAEFGDQLFSRLVLIIHEEPS